VAAEEPRWRDIAGAVGLLESGERNSITDVPGVRVGHSQSESGEPTGVTVVAPPALPAPAGTAVVNGMGELTGKIEIDERGTMETPVYLCGTHAVGVAHHAAVLASGRGPGNFVLPVVGECAERATNAQRRRAGGGISRFGEPAGAQGAVAVVDQSLEAVEVHVVGVGVDDVPTLTPPDRGPAVQRAAEVGHVAAHGRLRSRRRVVVPEDVDDPVERHDPTRLEQQQRQHRLLLRSADVRCRSVAGAGADAAEQHERRCRAGGAGAHAPLDAQGAQVPRNSTWTLRTSKPRRSSAGSGETVMSRAATSRSVPHVVHSRWWWAVATLGS